MVTAKDSALARRILKNLEDLQQQLQIAQAGATVAVQALKIQDAEQDWDIACVLEHCVGSRLSAQLESTDELIAALESDGADLAAAEPEESDRVDSPLLQ